jgi:sugar phosphate isomerase/epimerase
MDLDIQEFASRARLRGMPYARRLIDSSGLKMGVFNLPLEWDVNDDVFRKGLEKLADYGKAASEIGCTRCVATIKPAGDSRPYHENFEFHKHRFIDICRTLEPYGVRVGIGFRAAENLRKGQAFQFIHDLDAASLLVNMVGLPNVGLCLDVWDLHVAGGTVENVRGLAGDKIVAVQLADLPAEELAPGELTENHRALPRDEYKIDIPGMVTALAESGYEGPVTLKPARAAIRGLRRDTLVEKAGKSLGAIWSAAGLTRGGKIAVSAKS